MSQQSPNDGQPLSGQPPDVQLQRGQHYPQAQERTTQLPSQRRVVGSDGKLHVGNPDGPLDPAETTGVYTDAQGNQWERRKPPSEKQV